MLVLVLCNVNGECIPVDSKGVSANPLHTGKESVITKNDDGIISVASTLTPTPTHSNHK